MNDAESATIFREVIRVLFILALVGSVGYSVIKSNIKSSKIEGRSVTGQAMAQAGYIAIYVGLVYLLFSALTGWTPN